MLTGMAQREETPLYNADTISAKLYLQGSVGTNFLVTGTKG